MLVKSPMSVPGVLASPTVVSAGVAGRVGLVFILLAPVDGYQERKFNGAPALGTRSSLSPPRLINSPRSSLWAFKFGFASLVASTGHQLPPRPPSDDVTMPMCMSCT